jgi:hypothetical protein
VLQPGVLRLTRPEKAHDFKLPTMLLNPAGNILAISVRTGTQIFHFNGADPIENI